MPGDPPSHERLRSIIDSRAVRVVFQPIVDLCDGMIIAYEALSRPEPGTGVESAEEMFTSAEAHGLIWDLEQVTRSLSLAAAADWPRDVRLFLNCTPSVFADPRFAEVIADGLGDGRSLTPDRIVLEITEKSETRLTPDLARQVELAKKRGFGVAVDDAGAGTSGLNRMMLLRPHWVKLDHQIIAGIDTDSYKQNLVRFFVHFARMSGVNVVAEGIERPEELATLLGLGVRFGQGYYLARPGERSQTLDPAFVSQVRQRWAAVDATLSPDPHDMPLLRLALPALVVESGTTTAAQAAERLEREPDVAGVVVMSGRRFAGWIDRREILEGSRSGRTLQAPAEGARSIAQLGPSATIREALSVLAGDDAHELACPLFISSGAALQGVVPIRSLLKAAAAEVRAGSGGGLRAPLTGLPARVRADQHLEETICRADDPALRRAPGFHADCAFVDVRGIADYNGVFGYEMGDRLIRAVGELINSTVCAGDGSLFLAHLGEDRFLLTAPTGLLAERIPRLLAAFERLSPTLTDESIVAQLAARPMTARSRGTPPQSTGPQMGLRALIMPDVFERVAHPREIYRLEQMLRTRARSEEQSLPAGRSVLIVDRRYGTRSDRLVA